MGERQNMLLARQEAARGGRRTVPVAFESCRTNVGISKSCFFVYHEARMIFPSKYDRECFIAKVRFERSDAVEMQRVQICVIHK